MTMPQGTQKTVEERMFLEKPMCYCAGRGSKPQAEIDQGKAQIESCKVEVERGDAERRRVDQDSVALEGDRMIEEDTQSVAYMQFCDGCCTKAEVECRSPGSDRYRGS